MLDTSDMRRLAEINTHPHLTLSLYLALDQSRETRLLSLNQMFKRKEQQLLGNGASPDPKTFAAEQNRIVRFVEELPTGPDRGLALFACSPRELFETFTFPVSVPDQLQVGNAPYIRPIAALSGERCRAVTVLLDQRKARFFISFLGQIQELDQAQVDNPETKEERDGGQGRAGDNHLARKADEALGRHYKQINQTLMELFRGRQCRELAVGGSKVRVEHFLPHLHPYLAQNLAGVFNLDVNASPAAVAEQMAQVQAQARRQRQERLLANLADNLGPGGQAATGLNQVLASLYEGQVHTLLVRRGFTAAGGACPGCGRLRHVAGACPICGQAMTPVEDIVNLALAQALDSGAALEQVDGPSPLDGLGGVAALLRYA
ncbi:MAG: hypothetical protein ACOZHQ_08410 [Thermodesulfobacteriota bacterium]